MKSLMAIFAIFLLGGLAFAAGCVETPSSGMIQAGDDVTVEFTMYIGDTVMVTSNETKYNQILSSGKMKIPLILAEDPIITAGTSTDDDDLTIPTKTHKNPYWFLKGEYNVIAGNIVGLKMGDTIRIPIYADETDKTVFWTNEQCKEWRVDKHLIKAGDRLTYTKTIDNATGIGGSRYDHDHVNQKNMIREMLIVAVTDEGLTYQELYDTIEITVV
jgi:plastocyanin